MREVNVEEAQSELPQLLTRVEAGEEVVITRAGEPVARLVNCLPRRGKRQFGALKRASRRRWQFLRPIAEGRTVCLGGKLVQLLLDTHTFLWWLAGR